MLSAPPAHARKRELRKGLGGRGGMELPKRLQAGWNRAGEVFRALLLASCDAFASESSFFAFEMAGCDGFAKTCALFGLPAAASDAFARDVTRWWGRFGGQGRVCNGERPFAFANPLLPAIERAKMPPCFANSLQPAIGGARMAGFLCKPAVTRHFERGNPSLSRKPVTTWHRGGDASPSLAFPALAFP